MLHIRIHQQDLIVAIYLFLGQSDGHSLDLSRVGETPHNIKFSGLRYLQVQVQAPKLPQAGSFTLFDAALWLICCPLVEGPRIESGVFGGLWPLVRRGCSYSIWGRVFSEGMNTSRPVCECPNTCPQAGKFYTTASGVREDIGMIKSIIPAPQDLLLIDLFPNLAQKKSPCWAKSLCFGYPLVMGEIPGLFLCKSKVSSPHIQKLCSSP